MADDVSIAIRLRNAAKFVADSTRSAASIRRIGDESTRAGAAGRAMGTAFGAATGTMNSGFGAVAGQAKFAAAAVGAVGLAGVKMGLSFNAQIESARLRFGLFTDDVDGLTAAVQRIDMESAFNLGDLSDAAALLGNSGVKEIPNVLQGAANAATAAGKGAAGLQSIAIALSQIQAKGRVSQEEINQLNEAGAPGAQRIIAEGFGLTAKQMQNIGHQGLDATKALQLLTKEWTSGKMAKAAEAQTKTLGGQWMLLTGNVQKLAGAATESLAAGLRNTALPAVNETVQEITKIFGKEGLSNEQKIRKAREVLIRNLGPVWKDISKEIKKANLPEKFGEAVAAATPFILDTMADIAPKAAKAFVKGWLNSGPEAQAISLMVLGKKFTETDIGGGLFEKAKEKLTEKAKEKVFGEEDERGSLTNPLYVVVIKAPKSAASKAKTAVSKVAPYLPVAAAAGGVGAATFGLGYLAYKTADNDFAYGAGGAGARGLADSTRLPPGFGGNGGLTRVTVPLTIDGREFARATAEYSQMETARGQAAAAARK